MAEIKKSDILEAGIQNDVKEISLAFNELVKSIDGVIVSGKSLNEELKKGQTTRKETEKLNQKAATNAKNLEKSTIKLNNLQTNYTKSLVSLNKQKEKSAKDSETQAKRAAKEEERLAKTTKANKNSIYGLVQANKDLIAQRNKLDLSTESGQKQAAALNKQIDKNTEVIRGNSAAVDKQRMNIGNYRDALAGVPGPLGAVGNAMKMLAANPLILAMTVLVGAFSALYKALTRSEEGQNKLNKIMEVGGAILGKLADYVTMFANALVDAFTDPKKAIADLWGFLKSQFINRINALGKVFTSFGDLLKGVFTLDTDKIKKSAKEMGSAYVDSLTGVEKTLQKVKEGQAEVTAEIEKSIKAAEKAATLEAAAAVIKRKNVVENAQIEGKIAEKLAAAEKLKKSNAAEAIKITREAQSLQNKILQNKINEAQIDYEIIKAKNAQAINDADAKKAEAEAQAKYIQAQNAMNEKALSDAKKINTLIAERKRQINETLKAEIVQTNASTKLIIENNKKILADSDSNEKQKLDALKNITDAELLQTQQTADLKKKSYKEQLDANLITRETYDKMIKGAAQKQAADELAIVNKSETEQTKIKAAEAQKQYDIKVKKDAEINKQQLLALKKRFANGLITEKEYQAEVEKINQGGIQKQIDNLKLLAQSDVLNKDAKVKLLQQAADLQTKLDNEALDNQIANNAKSVEDKKKTEEQKAAAIEQGIQAAQQLINETFNFNKALNDRALNDIEKKQQFELQLAGDNEAAKTKINEKYDKKRAELQRKQAIADKAQALFNIAISTAVAVMKAAPVVPLMVAMGVLGAIQAGIVLAKPIPEFDEGTESAPSEFIAGEKRPELMKHKGRTSLITEPTYFGNAYKGAQIIGGAETAQILNNGLMDSIKLNGLKTSRASDTMQLKELRGIKRSIDRSKTAVNFDSKGISTIYGQQQNKIKRIDKYIS